MVHFLLLYLMVTKKDRPFAKIVVKMNHTYFVFHTKNIIGQIWLLKSIFVQGVPKSTQVLESFISGSKYNFTSYFFIGNSKRKFKILYAEKILKFVSQL